MNHLRRPALLAATAALLGGMRRNFERSIEESQMDENSSTPSQPISLSVEQSMDDLAVRLGIGADAIELASAEEVTWRNGSRGCARPGMAYTQTLINGARIILRAGGETYEYHSGGSRSPALCESPTE